MGLLCCCRNDCNDIMCNYFIDGDIRNYLCYDCAEEFKAIAIHSGKKLTEKKIYKKLNKFIETKCPDRSFKYENQKALDDFFRMCVR